MFHVKPLLAKYNRTAFLPLSMGCMGNSAWARLRLKEGINIVGDRYVYSDTDSVKYIKVRGDNIDELFDRYNSERKEQSISNSAYATDRYGVKHYMGDV